MGKSKKSFWKQMYLSNGWAIDKVVVPAVGILFFFAIGFLANVILEIPESIKTDEGASYYANLIVWYFASGFSTTGLIVAFCMFVYYVPYAAVSKTLAVARYCKLPLSREELIAAKNSNIFTDASSYFAYIRKNLEYCHGKRSLSLTDDEIEEAIRVSVEVFDLQQDDIVHVNDKFYARITLRNAKECNMECSNQLYKGEIIRKFFWVIRPDGTLYDPLKQQE